MSPKAITTAVLACLLAAFTTIGLSGQAPAQTLAPEEARAIAKDAYIFAYPVALQYHTAYIQAVDKNAKEYVGGFGKYRHYGMSTPANKDIVTPNNDTPYSWAQLDLRAEPWVLTLPKTDGRYLTTEWMDMWHFVLDNPGTVRDGDSGGDYLLASPHWQGTAPTGIKRVIRGESDFIGTLTRTGVSGPDDVPNLEKTQQGLKLQPLSSYLGQPAPPPAPALDFPAWVPGVEDTPDIFRYVNFMLQFIVPNPKDKPMLDRIAKIGIAPGKTWDLAAMKSGAAQGNRGRRHRRKKSSRRQRPQHARLLEAVLHACDLRRRLSQSHDRRRDGPVGQSAGTGGLPDLGRRLRRQAA